MKPNENIGYVVIETATTISDIQPAKIIREDKKCNRVIAQGTLQEANEKNRNGRFYDSRDLFPQLTAPRTLELLRTGNLRAENGHPLSKELVRQQTIDPEKTVAIFLKLWTEGNFIKATFQGTNDARGEEFNKDLLCGFSPSWSLRALGTIQNTARGAEVKGIKVITWDRVIYPSHPRAYTDGIISESAGIGVNNESNVFLEKNDAGILIPITNDSVINYIKSESANFKTIQESFDLLYDNIELINRGTQVKLTDRAGGIFVCNLESYIHDEIMNECLRLL
jgi:hypothetical protein